MERLRDFTEKEAKEKLNTLVCLKKQIGPLLPGSIGIVVDFCIMGNDKSADRYFLEIEWNVENHGHTWDTILAKQEYREYLEETYGFPPLDIVLAHLMASLPKHLPLLKRLHGGIYRYLNSE